MASAATLYTPRILELATMLARWPWVDELPLRGEARSRSCGSLISLALETDTDRRIARLGLRAQACAIGQAAAALFALSAPGRTAEDIADSEAQLRGWLGGDGPLPDWPGIGELAAARAYPGRHGAILLAWQAAREALPSV